MGLRGELFSTRVARENRTYFFNVKENRLGEMFLTVVESKHCSDGTFERHQVMVFQEDFPDFAEGMEKVIGFMKKERYKRATGRDSRSRNDDRNDDRDSERDRDDRPRRDHRPRTDDRPPANDRPEAAGTVPEDEPVKKPRKVHTAKPRPRKGD